MPRTPRADPCIPAKARGTVAELVVIGWSRYFRRVCLDPVRGVITLMSPLHLQKI